MASQTTALTKDSKEEAPSPHTSTPLNPALHDSAPPVMATPSQGPTPVPSLPPTPSTPLKGGNDGGDSEVSSSTQASDAPTAPARRMTSRANLVRQNSAMLLRRDTTPTLLRRSSRSRLFPEPEDLNELSTVLYYYSDWNPPYVHHSLSDYEGWTQCPGVPMTQCVQDTLVKAGVPYSDNVLPDKNQTPDGESVWTLKIVGIPEFEFVPNDDGRKWDKAPGNQNYKINGFGRFCLRRGVLHEIVDPPEHPALLKDLEVGSTTVKLVWNPPLQRAELVTGYRVFRDGDLIASCGESECQYHDSNLMGLTTYTYCVRAINSNLQMGRPSETISVTTAEPGKASAPSDVKVSKHSTNFVELQWRRPDHGGAPIQYYKIYRDGEPFGIQGATQADWQSWTDSKVEAGRTYVYHVSALHSLPRLSRDAKTEENSKSPDMGGSGGGGSGPESGTGASGALTIEQYRDIILKLGQEETEGALSGGVEAKAVTMLDMPRLHDRKPHIILQAFNWRSAFNKNGWWNVLKKKAHEMHEAGITMAWLPPPSQSVAAQGYMPTKWFQLDTPYGKTEELKAMLTEMRHEGVSPMLDFVVNHRCGTKQDANGNWTIFEDPEWGPWAIVGNNQGGPAGAGNQDTGEQSEYAPDLDHTNKKVREDIRRWTKWLFEQIGFNSLRIDMAPGYSVGYQVEYVETLGSPFTVGEYWSGDQSCLQNYVNSCKGRIAAYDFALYYVLRRCVETNNFGEMNNNGRLNGLVGRTPELAVTFIENHDTEHLDFVGKFAGGNGDAALRGYAVLLTHPGTPCLYWNHWSDYGENMTKKINELCNVRKTAGINSVSGIYIAESRWGLYAAYISRDRHCHNGGGQVAMKVGSDGWHPQGGGWRVATSGNGYCVWQR